MFKSFRTSAPFLTIFMLSASIAFGQATSGDLVGTVKDATGALVPNATVIVTSEATHVATTTHTNSAGEYRVSNLLPSLYDVKVDAPGFQSYLLKALSVQTSQTATANANLAVANSTTVEVTATAGVTLDTTSENLTTTFSFEEVGYLPTATSGNGVLNLSLLAPNIASPGGAGIGTGPSVGGQRPRNNNYTVEGIDDNAKSVTGPLLEIPNDAVGDFTLITSQFSPEFGHSSGGQFNTNVRSGTNNFHGRLYEYFDNRNLNAQNAISGHKLAVNPRYDFNRYGGQLGGPVVRNKLFFFANFERSTLGESGNLTLCTPTAAGIATLNSLGTSYGFRATNLMEYTSLVPAANVAGGVQVTSVPNQANSDQACEDTTGPQYLTVSNSATGTVGATNLTTQIPLGNAQLSLPSYENTDQATISVDYTPTPKDSFRFRYSQLLTGSIDTEPQLPVFWGTAGPKYYFGAASWFHTFSPSVINELRIGYNRYSTSTPVAGPSFPGLAAFPNFTIYDAGIDIGPNDNAPQSTLQNLYQATDNISWTKGRNTFKFGFDGRKYISPQVFVQRQRGDYQWTMLDYYLHDLAPDYFGERSAGASTYYGDQTALYGYGNDTLRATDKLTLNLGLRYEFTSVPVGERRQSANALSNVPGLIAFNAPQPQYTNFAPRVGVAYAPNSSTSIRAGFGMAYDVLFDNLGLLSSPPQFAQTNDVGSATGPAYLAPNFLANGGLPAGLTPITSAAVARANTAAYLPNQILPYSINYNLTLQRTFGKDYTAEIQYLGTRGVHLPTQNQTNIQPLVTPANQLTTYTSGPTLNAAGTAATIATAANANTLAAITSPTSYYVPAYYNAGFTDKITSYQPYGGSNYNGLGLNLTRRFSHGLATNISYTYSRAMDDSTAEVNSSALTERRPQDSRNQHAEYSRSALDHPQRLTASAAYELPFLRNRGFLLRSLGSGWQVSPIFTYESPEFVTATSNTNSNLNGDSGGVSRTIVNPNASHVTQGTALGSAIVPVYSTTLTGNCTAPATTCSGNLVGYLATNPNAYYIVAGKGTLPNQERNTLMGNPIDNLTMEAGKRIILSERYSFEVQAQAFNVLNHAQYVPGNIDDIAATSSTTSNTTLLNYLTPGSQNFNLPNSVFTAHARSMQLSAKFNF